MNRHFTKKEIYIGKNVQKYLGKTKDSSLEKWVLLRVFRNPVNWLKFLEDDLAELIRHKNVVSLGRFILKK